MQRVLSSTRLPPDKNIFLYYALGKELEDLEQWQEAFRYYKLAGDAVSSVARYDVAEDIALIDKVIEVCDAQWLARGPEAVPTDVAGKTPIFIVGLPRTGTTLTERILASHSRIESMGETLFMQMTLRQVSGVQGVGQHDSRDDRGGREAGHRPDRRWLPGGGALPAGRQAHVHREAAVQLPVSGVHRQSLSARPPGHQRRDPMDSCFAMYKQVFTWAYKFSYSLEGLGRYYVAYDRLARHWRAVLGERLIEVDYEEMVADQEGQTRRAAGAARAGLRAGLPGVRQEQGRERDRELGAGAREDPCPLGQALEALREGAAALAKHPRERRDHGRMIRRASGRAEAAGAE